MVLRFLERILAPCLNKAILHTDGPEERRYKLILIALGVLFLLSGAAQVVLGTFKYRQPRTFSLITDIAVGTEILLGIFLSCYPMVSPTMNKRLVEITFYVFSTITICLADLASLVLMVHRSWALFVIVLDVTLVLKMSSTIQYAFITTVITWLMLAFISELDLIGFSLRESLVDYSLEDLRATPHVCDCAHPPCGGDAELKSAGLYMALTVFLTDFFITRSFASQVEQEKNAMQCAIDTAERVAAALARFDLAVAEDTLHRSSSDIPEDLLASFQQLLANLAQYRPYLPPAMLLHPRNVAFDDSTQLVPPPGEGVTNPEVGIMFTDIRGSTMLWEECFDMDAVMLVHNSVVRAAVQSHGGYEVKTIGDAFMAAFSSPEAAVTCGLDVQRGMYEAEWPGALLEYRRCTGGEDGWPGLLVRIGVNYGPVRMDINSLTERMDYFGPTVNRAARLEAVAPPGSVAVFEDLYRRCAFSKSTPLIAATHLGYKELKGLPGRYSVLVLAHVAMRNLLADLSSGGSVLEEDGHTSGGGSLTGASDRRNRVRCWMAGNSVQSPQGAVAATSSRTVAVDPRSLGVKPSASGGAATSLFADFAATKCSVALIQLHAGDEDSEREWGCLKGRFLTITTWLRRTDGAVLSVAGLSIFAAWGLLKKTDMHALASFRFAGLLQDNIARTSEFPVTCGLSTGVVSGCHVGGADARFLAYRGRCINLAYGLCGLAQRLRADVLYSSEEGEGAVEASIRDAVRPVGYVEAGIGGRVSVAYEVSGVHAGRLYTRESFEREWGWSEGYTELFDAGNVAAIRRRATELGDAVLINAARTMEMPQ